MLVADKFRNWVFNQVHENNLVYNTCWEDPRCDRSLMDFDADSEIVMITSAGCNALDYLLDDPESIHCVDVNPRQNALLDLKLALFRQADHETLFQYFGRGSHPKFEDVYYDQLRSDLDDYAQTFWDKHIKYFSEKGVRKSFYHYGTSGTFAFLFSTYMKSRKKLNKELQLLLKASSLPEQKERFSKIEHKILNRLMEYIVNRHVTMCLLGVPRSQQELFMHELERGAMGFIQSCLQHVFTELPISENYFYRVYINGSYTADCCPEYLKQKNFPILQNRIDRIKTYSTSLSDFLICHPGKYSHFVLLDHQDWLAEHAREALAEEWHLILSNSRPGTKILMRSAASEVDFFPDFVLDRVQFETKITATAHQLDRVGTYASVYLAEVL